MSSDLKKQAALAALDEVQEGMVLGIGTGSTAEAFVDALAGKVADGLIVKGIPTSERTRERCESLSIPLVAFEEYPIIDLTVDGADEIDGDLNLIKGGGALLREKVVAAASRRMIVIADASKVVTRLGAFPLPIEISAFGVEPTRLAIDRICRRHAMEGELTLRTRTEGEGLGEPFRTDGGNYVLDASFGAIADARALSLDLLAVPGVVDHGLFIGMADAAFVAGEDGVRRMEPRAG